MNLVRRPWSLRTEKTEKTVLGPEDCFLGLARSGENAGSRYAKLLLHSDQKQELRLFPYPKIGKGNSPVRIAGLPVCPKKGLRPKTSDEKKAVEVSSHMHCVLARIEEIKGSLDDPENFWKHLQEAWDRAEDESNPRMAEIVRQADEVKFYLLELEKRIRHVLRRNRELTPLNRVQEMDRSSMVWMVRQPGRTIAERAGADQRVLAIVRHESFDTLENRVLHAYLRLASHFARQWIREHERARNSRRYRAVEDYFRLCRRLSHKLTELGVAIAEPEITANYVLMEDRDYRTVKDAWGRLLRKDKAEDDLWAWQAESWTDFCVLAVILALYGLDEAKLLAQSPLIWKDEAVRGRRFLHDRPLAVFWLRNSGLIVEVQARPDEVSSIQFDAGANVWLQVADLRTEFLERRIPIWTPHSFCRMSPVVEAHSAASSIEELHWTTKEVMQEGLILMPAYGEVVETGVSSSSGVRIQAISIDAAGETLEAGKKALARFVRTCFQVEEE
ncbi:MAG: DUF2357 domain-containing protein [Gammaproteobacteria bacterium]|nr:DUF2357 domain-containing protein [Gammaproteobacteria bacterium]